MANNIIHRIALTPGEPLSGGVIKSAGNSQ